MSIEHKKYKIALWIKHLSKHMPYLVKDVRVIYDNYKEGIFDEYINYYRLGYEIYKDDPNMYAKSTYYLSSMMVMRELKIFIENDYDIESHLKSKGII
jgi:hypothetical protein